MVSIWLRNGLASRYPRGRRCWWYSLQSWKHACYIINLKVWRQEFYLLIGCVPVDLDWACTCCRSITTITPLIVVMWAPPRLAEANCGRFWYCHHTLYSDHLLRKWLVQEHVVVVALVLMWRAEILPLTEYFLLVWLECWRLFLDLRKQALKGRWYCRKFLIRLYS